MNDIETRSEAIRASEMVRAKSCMNRPKPDWDMKPRETKTTRVESVAEDTAEATSLAPWREASRGAIPFSCRSRKMFSRTTTLLSTSMPTAIISPESEMMLMEMLARKTAR